MYLGSLTVGADLTSGILALGVINNSNVKIAPLFKDFQANFLKRAEGDVHFVCNEGEKIRSMIQETAKSKQRVNKTIAVTAYVPKKLGDEPVAEFSLTLSIKAK